MRHFVVAGIVAALGICWLIAGISLYNADMIDSTGRFFYVGLSCFYLGSALALTLIREPRS